MKQRRTRYRRKVFEKAMAQLLDWISSRTRVTVGFYDKPLVGSLSGELSPVEECYGEMFLQITGGEGDRVIFCPVLAESLSIKNNKGHCKIEMKCGDFKVQICPFVDAAELLKSLPVTGRLLN